MVKEIFEHFIEPLVKGIFRVVWWIFRGVFIELIFWFPELLLNAIFPDTDKKRTWKTYLLGWTFIIAVFGLAFYLAAIVGNTPSPI